MKLCIIALESFTKILKRRDSKCKKQISEATKKEKRRKKRGKRKKTA